MLGPVRIVTRTTSMGEACSTHGTEENSCRILVRKYDVKTPLGRPKRR